jgi:hypothetical protein
MSNDEITAYIISSKKRGVSEDEILEKLKKLGWTREEITKAFANLPISSENSLTSNTQQNPVPATPKQSSGMWDAFEHILLFISLYIMAMDIAAILNYFVDKWFPGVVVNNNSYNYLMSNSDWQLTLLRCYLAALIVSVPLFSFFFLDITKRTLKNPLIRHIKARKILIYFTLIITFLIMIGEIIGILYTLLSGNVTLNFILHFTVTLLVSGTVFTYYFWQIKEDRKINA